MTPVPKLAADFGLTDNQAKALFDAMMLESLRSKFQSIALSEELVKPSELDEISWEVMVHQYRLKVNDDITPRELVVSILKNHLGKE